MKPYASLWALGNHIKPLNHMSSAMTFFQGKRNETFPERFTIVS